MVSNSNQRVWHWATHDNYLSNTFKLAYTRLHQINCIHSVYCIEEKWHWKSNTHTHMRKSHRELDLQHFAYERRNQNKVKKHSWIKAGVITRLYYTRHHHNKRSQTNNYSISEEMMQTIFIWIFIFIFVSDNVLCYFVQCYWYRFSLLYIDRNPSDNSN